MDAGVVSDLGRRRSLRERRPRVLNSDMRAVGGSLEVSRLPVGFAVAPAARAIEGFASAHWKSKIEMEGGRQGGRMPSELEIWMKSGKMRMKTSAGGMEMNILKLGDDMYNWAEGQPTGMKI